MKKPGAALLAALFTFVMPMAFGKNLYVDYSFAPDPLQLLVNEVCILHPNCNASLDEGQQRGNEFYAYLSLVEISPEEKFLNEVQAAGIRLPGENKEWNSKLVDIRQPAWREFFVNSMAKKAIDKNYDGFFIDTADSIQLLCPDRSSPEYAEYQTAAIEILKALKGRYPDKKIILNRGFDLVGNLSGIVEGVLVESVFSTTDIEGTKTVQVDWSTTGALLTEIDNLQVAGFETYAIDYVAPGDRETAILAERRIRSLGCIPCIATRKLDGTNPYEKKVARKILVVYGHDPAETESDPMMPGDTLTLGKFQFPLEWMGYEFEYHNISNGVPDFWSDDEFCGVIIDESLSVPHRYEVTFAKWLAKRLADKKKVLFLSTCNFSSSIAKELVFFPLGVTFEGTVPPSGGGDVVAMNINKDFMNYEVPTKAIRSGFQALQAPIDAEVLVSLAMKTANGQVINYEPAFIADWGAFLLEPYASYQVSPEIDLSHVDPFQFLGAIWPDTGFPVPDVTTKQGLRIFYSHIDGDGFISIGRFPGRPICGEVMYEKVLKDLPFPVTVSIVEAEVRGHMLVQVDPDVEFHEEMARRIFELPHIEPASHSYSHPYVWDLKDKSNYKNYASLNLPLKLQAKYPQIQLDREINGSLDYIKEKLSGTDNPPKIFLWSGNCRPPAEALRLVREYGIENMNGGNTILSKGFPGLSGVAPKMISADGELQIFASNQNEFYYTNGWQGPFFNGFRKVIETFEMTEHPKRMKPVNVYYHFYSAERQDALSSLHAIYDWCEQQELHMMTTAEYATMVRDSHSTEIYQLKPNRFKIRNEGRQQTFRVPAKMGYPDLDLSSGVIGYRQFQDSLYIATDGSKEIYLTFNHDKATSPYLVTSTEKVATDKQSRTIVSWRNTSSVRDSTITVGGLSEGAWTLEFSGGTQKSVDSGSGAEYSFILPQSQTVTITPTTTN